MKPVIELKSVTKRYGDVVGVEDININVQAGSVFGFLGPNGAGKSTTINMLLDFIRPTTGSLRLFGKDAQEHSVEIHKRIGFLAGDMALDRGLSGWQQLEYLGNLRGGFDKSYVEELAKRLDCRLDRKFKTLSRGNKQKVGLIAALMHKPELLIFDEPTSGLDPLIQAEFNKIILERKQAGATAFISSHMLSEVQELCDTVAFIRKGKLVSVGPIGDLSVGSPKHFKLSPTTKKLRTSLEKLKGISIADETEGALRGSYSGDINELVGVLSKHELTDFMLEEADLESNFMKYYEDEVKNA